MNRQTNLLRRLVAVLSGALLAQAGWAAALPLPDAPFTGKLAPDRADSEPAWPEPVTPPKGAPNVVLILLDDVGFSDAGTFGGPVRTPALDQLASGGLRYNCFNTAAMCSPTRASLLTGRNHHRVGFGFLTDFDIGYPGYNGVWKKSTASIAEILRGNGYSTAAFGKWHNTPTREGGPTGPFDHWPTGLGFEYFYGFLGWSTSQWEPTLYRNTLPVEPPAPEPGQEYHFTTDITDDAIRWVRTHESLAPDRPYFLYFATGAAHAPHHAPKEWIDQYRGKFDQGWDELRKENFARQKQLGVIPADAELTPRPKELPSWASIPAGEKAMLARQMEVYAGFLAHTDHEVGRLIKAVQGGASGDNTLILYIVGDNGAAGEGGVPGEMDRSGDAENGGPRPLAEQLRLAGELGGPLHDNLYSGCWAWAGTTPFQWFKSIASHFGGIRNPLVVSWPRRIADHGGLRTQFTHVNDVAATIYDAAGIAFPSAVNGIAQQPLDGVSFVPTFANAALPSPHRVQYFEILGNRSIYQDGWVAAARHSEPFHKVSDDCSGDRWELYHLDRDFSEAHDLAAENPRKLRELQQLFDREARANSVYPLLGSSARRQRGDARKDFVFYAGMPRTAVKTLPIFTTSYRISAEVTLPRGGAQGVIMSYGGRWGGFDLYLQGGRLIYENFYADRTRQIIASATPLPAGPVSIAFEFERDPGPPASKAMNGTGRLLVNGRLAGSGRLTFYPRAYYGSMGIGEAFDSSVSTAFTAPFKFTGSLEKIRVELK